MSHCLWMVRFQMVPFFFFLLLICIVWFCCGEYALLVSRAIIKIVPKKIQFYYNIKQMKLDTKLYKQCDLNFSEPEK